MYVQKLFLNEGKLVMLYYLFQKQNLLCDKYISFIIFNIKTTAVPDPLTFFSMWRWPNVSTSDLIHFEEIHENTSPGKQKYLVQMSMFHVIYVQINILCHGIYYLFVFENLSALAIKSHL